MNINYDYYRVFYHVAKSGSFTKAAAALFSNQPNVTRIIKNLEAELGCTLFVRSNRGIRLTAEGETLFKHISAAVEQIVAGEQELTQDGGLSQGVLSVAASEVALHCLLLPTLKQFKQQHPGIRLRISNHSTPQAIRALHEGLAELAVVTTPVILPKSMRKILLKEVQEVPVCGSAFASLTRRPLSLKELTENPIICLSKETMTHQFYSDWFTQYGISLAPDIEPATADQVLPMVKNNLGIGFVPEAFLESDSDQKSIYRLELTHRIPPRHVCLVKRTDQPLSPTAKELEKLLSHSAAQE